MAVEKPSFVYTTYIVSTPERVFAALTDPAMTTLYWGHHRNRSNWTKGACWSHEDFSDPAVVHIVGEVVEIDPPNRLVITWANPAHADDAARVSRVTFDISTFRGSVKLFVAHEDLEPESEMLRGITMGWPAVLSSLKSLLETGKPVPGTDERWHE